MALKGDRNLRLTGQEEMKREEEEKRSMCGVKRTKRLHTHTHAQTQYIIRVYLKYSV